MASTVWNGSVDTDWNTPANWTPSGVPLASAHIQISTTNDCALDQSRSCASLTIDSGATLIGGGYTLTVTSEGDASSGTEHFAVNNDGIISGELNLNITTPATTSCDFAGSTGKFHDVTINHASCQVNLESTTQFTGDLNITLGKMVCGGNTVEITGRTDIGPASGAADQATLQCDASAMFLGSGRTSSFALVVNQGGTFTGGSGNHTIGSFEVKNNSNAKMTMTNGECTIDSENSGDGRAILVETNATFDNNDGTIKITHAGDTDIEFKSGTTSPKCPHNLTIDKSNNDVVTHGNLRIDNNLFIKIVDTSHSMRPSSASDTLTVIGDVTLNKGKLGATTNYTSAISFGSLTIDADGEYIATSGTTTITSKTSDDYGIKGGGIFTHNNGEVKITGNAYRFPVGANYYDLTIDGSEPFYQYSTAVGTAATGASGGATIDGTTNAQYMRVDGTMKINDRGFVPYNSHKVFINNLIIGDNTDSANATNLDLQDNDVFDGDVIVNNILINADGQLKFGDNHAGNSDALEVRGAFRSLGGASGVVVV